MREYFVVLSEEEGWEYDRKTIVDTVGVKCKMKNGKPEN